MGQAGTQYRELAFSIGCPIKTKGEQALNKSQQYAADGRRTPFPWLLRRHSKVAAVLSVMGKGVSVKTYKLLAADGTTVISKTPGTLGGNAKAKIYGRLDCSAANGALSKGYAEHRVFFADEENAIQAGYRPCGRCMTSQYKDWKSGPDGKESYPWKQLPK